MGFWKGVLKNWKVIAGLTAFAVGIGGYFENEEKQAAKRDRAPKLTSSERAYSAGGGLNPKVLEVAKTGAPSAIMKGGMKTQYKNNDYVEGTSVQIQTASGQKETVIANPKDSGELKDKQANIDTLHGTSANGVDMTGHCSANDGNTLVSNGRLNKGQVGLPATQKTGETKSVSKTVSQNGNQVVYRGAAPKTGIKKTMGSLSQKPKVVQAPSSGPASKAYNTRKGKYTPSGQPIRGTGR